MNTREAVASLASTVCPACSREKKARQTFCNRDYWRLSPELRSALYRPVGGGYEAAVAAAIAYLKAGKVDVPPTGKPSEAASEPAKPTEQQGELFPSSPRYRV